MTIVNKIKIKEEILNFLRNNDLIPITDRNVTTDTETITATAGQTDFTIVETKIIRNIRSVTVNAVSKEAYVDYDIGIIDTLANTKIVSFYSGLSLNDEVIITYDVNNAIDDRIYADMTEVKVIKGGFPRINIEIEESTDEPINSNHSKYNKMLVLTVRVLAERWELETLSQSTYQLVFNNKQSWQNNNLMRPSGQSGIKPVEGRKDVLVKFLYFRMPFEFES